MLTMSSKMKLLSLILFLWTTDTVPI